MHCMLYCVTKTFGRCEESCEEMPYNLDSYLKRNFSKGNSKERMSLDSLRMLDVPIPLLTKKKVELPRIH